MSAGRPWRITIVPADSHAVSIATALLQHRNTKPTPHQQSASDGETEGTCIVAIDDMPAMESTYLHVCYDVHRCKAKPNQAPNLNRRRGSWRRHPPKHAHLHAARQLTVDRSIRKEEKKESKESTPQETVQAPAMSVMPARTLFSTAIPISTYQTCEKQVIISCICKLNSRDAARQWISSALACRLHLNPPATGAYTRRRTPASCLSNLSILPLNSYPELLPLPYAKISLEPTCMRINQPVTAALPHLAPPKGFHVQVEASTRNSRWKFTGITGIPQYAAALMLA